MEEQLAGGVANAGAVTRNGDQVLRPAPPNATAIHRFLRHLSEVGFQGASEPLGIDPDGRERLRFIEGQVPIPPYPSWAQTDTALASVAALIADLHRSAEGFSPVDLEWSLEMADPAGGTIVCHNDVCLENVVFRDGTAIALLDFDFAAPGRPLYDLAQFARMCVPVDDDVSASNLGWAHADRIARLRLVVETYGLDRVSRLEFLEILSETIARGGEFVARRVEAGDANFIEMWSSMGGMERFDRRRRWWSERRDEFAAALL